MPLRRPPGSLSRIPDSIAERVSEVSPPSGGSPGHRPSSPGATRRRIPSHPQVPQEMETVGFEPTTPCLQSRCSPTELRPRGRGCQQLRPSRSTATLARHHTVTQGKPHSAQQNVVGQGGLEPPTPRLSSVCSNQLSYWPKPLPNPSRACGVPAMLVPCAGSPRCAASADASPAGGAMFPLFWTAVSAFSGPAVCISGRRAARAVCTKHSRVKSKKDTRLGIAIQCCGHTDRPTGFCGKARMRAARQGMRRQIQQC